MTAKLIDAPAEVPPDGGYALRVVETRGRRTGAPRRVPLAVVARDGGHYLVSPVRDRDWVENLLTTPECALLSGGRREERRAEPAGGEEAAAVVAAYLAAMSVPWAIRAFPVAQDAGLDEILEHLAGMAVFRLSTVDAS
ncbi:nitroreductase family deazaflavin-dependent oxidoreductase [Amycolatopsis sp. A133]|uniref:nitroreductase family deazaflavin-dependent oxidoreductase n=1 Tax=Amycolatopsis sp. A133 TaxID=3064472 RepID=UPI0027EAC89B|nr:nitroreductase family deazaflavin-dependent oxidoreductase [Amycolatopsis sp. A133]MDQ7804453.1 nitroreductase family deazaflavin-dependent oxidoreductase [Amycolatopsis sp. A133]